MTIAQLKSLKESEDKVEFKEAKHNYPFAGGSHTDQADRRKCFLGYVVAFANECGGMLVLGMADKVPHDVVGSDFAAGKLGALEDETLARLGVRIRTEELFENGNRVVVVHIPSRPVGKLLKFEGVPLMRVGDSLRNMEDEEIFAILSEQEPDFSAKVCEGLTVVDLDEKAIELMKASYAVKQKNPGFKELSNEQALSDLKLLEDGKLNYAALILLGKQSLIKQKLPQARIVWEYRNEEAQIHHDAREVIEDCLFVGIEKVWSIINQPALNHKHPIQVGAHIFDIFDFNKEVVREAILNAVAHRDYTITSEVVIKQYPSKIIINNPGGFPKGVTIENILTVSSTPRSRLMTEVLEKTGLVERSGQGVDKIYSITLSEGKHEPNYNNSDMLQVSLELKAEIVAKAFFVFITGYQNSDKQPKLGVEHIITLTKIREGIQQHLKPAVVAQLEAMGLIQKELGHTTRYFLSKEYDQLVNDGLKIGKRYVTKELEKVLLLAQGNALKVSDFEEALVDVLSRNQITYLLTKLVQDKILKTGGKLRGTRYSLTDAYADLRGDVLLAKVTGDLKAVYD